jgi:hypothetical protein
MVTNGRPVPFGLRAHRCFLKTTHFDTIVPYRPVRDGELTQLSTFGELSLSRYQFAHAPRRESTDITPKRMRSMKMNSPGK